MNGSVGRIRCIGQGSDARGCGRWLLEVDAGDRIVKQNRRVTVVTESAEAGSDRVTEVRCRCGRAYSPASSLYLPDPAIVGR